MSRHHALPHGRHRGLQPVIWVAVVVVALFISSLVAIVLLLHELVTLALQIHSTIQSYLGV
jgi:hypothetical protein